MGGAFRRLVAERKLQLLTLAERRTLVLAAPPSSDWPSLAALGAAELPQRETLLGIKER